MSCASPRSGNASAFWPIASIADGEGIHPAYTAQRKAIQSARLLAVKLGLSVVSRARSFQGKDADKREWDELDVG